MPSKVNIAVLLLLPAALQANVNIVPDKPPVVTAGGVLRLKANVPVRWSLSPSSPGSIDPDGTYHAPASLHVKNAVGGCQLLGNDHILNTRIDTLSVDPRSQAWVALFPAASVSYFPAWGLNIADHSTPRTRMHFLYTPRHDGDFKTVPWPALKRQNGVFSDARSPLDRHEITIDRETCDVYEIYSMYEQGVNKGCPTCTAQSGVSYKSTAAQLPDSSADAAGLLLAPLSLGLEELRAGSIDHALRMTLKNNFIAPRFVWPARANAGAWGQIPYGSRFRLKASYDTAKFSPYAQVLLKQLKEYGLIIADGGLNFQVSAFTDVTEDPAAEAALAEVGLKGPRSTDFEVVDQTGLMASASSGALKNEAELVKPEGYATAIATSTDHNSDVGQVRITLQGITVGVLNPSEWVQSGVSTKFQAWVNGTTEKGVRWTMNPPLGTLTPEGSYSAPEVERPTVTQLTAASTADPKSVATIAVTVMPKGPIRVAVGNATKAPGAPNRLYPDYGPDSNGDMWWRGQGGEVSWGVTNDDWRGAAWPQTKDIQLFYTSRYSVGDMVYRFFVPNGGYKITLMFAQPQCKGAFPRNWRAPVHLETQGKIAVPNFDMGAGIGNACLTPVVESIPAVVSDNSLYFAIRRVTSGPDMPSPLLSAFSVIKDDSPPHLSVTPSKVASLTINQQIQFKTVGWRMAEQAKWAVVKGPGTVSADGLYTAPAAPPANDQPVVLEAKSTTDPSKTATAEMMLKFGKFALVPENNTIVRSLSLQLTPEIDGAKHSNVNWSLQPKVGSIAADGTYTAPDHLAQDTTVTVTAESKDVAGKTAATTINVKAAPDPIRIDCGSSAGFKDAQGNMWGADYGFSKPSMAYRQNTPIAKASSDMQVLYQSARYRYPNEKFDYHFDLPNGRYAVTLKFADYSFNEAGHYNFDVVLNGEKVLTNFDFDTVYGPKTAVDKRFETTVKDRTLAIEFIGRGKGASVGGLEIVYLGEAVTSR